jgi:very-short-patch-repair endonuclease
MLKPIGNSAEQTLAYQCLSDKLPPFEQNYRFHPNRKYEIDLAFPRLKVGVEVNGGVWNGATGAHGSPLKILRDMEKGNLLVLAGWRVLRYTPSEVENGAAIAGLKQLIEGIIHGTEKSTAHPA